jgi:hypothetical protein
MSLSCATGGVLTGETTVAVDDTHHGPGDCDGCRSGDHEGIDAGICLVVCGIAAQGLMPGELLTLPSTSRADFQIAGLHLSGEFHSPEHGPPKISLLAEA